MRRYTRCVYIKVCCMQCVETFEIDGLQLVIYNDKFKKKNKLYSGDWISVDDNMYMQMKSNARVALLITTETGLSLFSWNYWQVDPVPKFSGLDVSSINWQLVKDKSIFRHSFESLMADKSNYPSERRERASIYTPAKSCE